MFFTNCSLAKHHDFSHLNCDILYFSVYLKYLFELKSSVLAGLFIFMSFIDPCCQFPIFLSIWSRLSATSSGSLFCAHSFTVQTKARPKPATGCVFFFFHPQARPSDRQMGSDLKLWENSRNTKGKEVGLKSPSVQIPSGLLHVLLIWSGLSASGWSEFNKLKSFFDNNNQIQTENQHQNSLI